MSRNEVLQLKTLAITGIEGESKRYDHKVFLIQDDNYPDSLILRIDGGPGHWYLSTLFGTSRIGSGQRVGSFLYIDMGQKWACFNMDQLLAEVEQLFGVSKRGA